jgi:predicted DNA-binding transcriptional regulator AlpA
MRAHPTDFENYIRHLRQALDALPAFVSPTDLAKLFSVRRPTIRGWVLEGRLPPPLRLSQHIHRWPRATIQERILALAGEAVPA